MRLLVQDSTGRISEAVLLAITPFRMRLALRGDDDTAELSYRYGEWVTEDGHPMEIALILADDQLPLGSGLEQVLRAGSAPPNL